MGIYLKYYKNVIVFLKIFLKFIAKLITKFYKILNSISKIIAKYRMDKIERNYENNLDASSELKFRSKIMKI